MRYSRNKIIFAIVAFLTILSLVVFLFSSQNKTNIDVLPEGTNLNTSTHAYIVNGDELVQKIGSLSGFDDLGRDLYVFGKTAYEPYKAGSSDVIGFEIVSDIKSTDKEVSFMGRFGSSNNRVNVKVSKLKNNKIVASITDKETGLNIDDSLPSNSAVNVFLGSLPIDEGEYNIIYLPNDGVGINIYSREASIYDKAYGRVVEAVGKENAEDLDLSVSFPTPSFNE